MSLFSIAPFTQQYGPRAILSMPSAGGRGLCVTNLNSALNTLILPSGHIGNAIGWANMLFERPRSGRLFYR